MTSPAARSRSRCSPDELHDHATLPAQIAKLKTRFGLARVVVVCDRGIVTQANIDLLAATDGVGWITALKAPQIKRLLVSGALQLSLFDEQNLAEITSPDYPGERLVVCRNPLVGAQRTHKREALLAATETELQLIADRVTRGTLHGADAIGLAVGPAIKRYRVKKHFQVQITDTSFTFTRKTDQIAAERSLDGFYVIRTSEPATALASEDVVRAYKGLEQAERAFKTFKGPELQIRPIHHHLEDRVRAHVLLCMLAYYLTWHLRAAWAPLLFKDEHPPVAPDPVAKATRSRAAQQKAQTKRTADRRDLPQLQEPARRARDPDAQHDPHPRQHPDLRQAHPADRASDTRTRPRRTRPRPHVVTTHTPHPPQTPLHRAKNRNPTTRTSD